MTDENRPPDRLSADDLVDWIPPEVALDSHLIPLRGYLGADDGRGTRHLYRGPGADEYLVIQEDDIKQRRRLGPSEGSIVWVPRDAAVLHVRRRTPGEIQAGYFQGEVAAAWPGVVHAGSAWRLPWVPSPWAGAADSWAGCTLSAVKTSKICCRRPWNGSW